MPVAHRLFARARTPEQIVGLSGAEILELIRASTFPENKAAQIHQISQQILDKFNGTLPADPQILTQFKGVEPKCAHLALGVALGYPCSGSAIRLVKDGHRVATRLKTEAGATLTNVCLPGRGPGLPRPHTLNLPP